MTEPTLTLYVRNVRYNWNSCPFYFFDPELFHNPLFFLPIISTKIR